MLSFFVAVGVSGAAFVSIGLFFSALTQNQIVAAVLTFVVLLMFMMARWTRLLESLGATVKTGLSKLAYWNLWDEALRGQLLVGDMLIQASIAVFGVFLTIKVLEARKWS